MGSVYRILCSNVLCSHAATQGSHKHPVFVYKPVVWHWSVVYWEYKTQECESHKTNFSS